MKASSLLLVVALCAVLVSLTAAAPQEAPAVPPNLAANPGFETDANQDGIPDSWVPFDEKMKKTGSVALTGDTFTEGKASVRIDGEGFGGIGRRVAGIEKGEAGPLEIAISAKLDAPRPDLKKNYTFGISFHCNYTDGSKKWVNLPEGCFATDTDQWQTLTFQWKPEKPLDALILRVMYVGPGYACFDNVSVTKPAK